MIDRKKIRKIIGYTHEKQISNPDLWYKKSLAFHEATTVLYEFKERIRNRIYFYTAALSLELILKTISVMEGQDINDLKTHNLRTLCNRAEVQLNEDQMFLLYFFSESTIWFSRYPAPLLEEEWDNYQDNVFEKLIVRKRLDSSSGYTRVAPKRFPSIDNYNDIWEVCLTKCKSVSLRD
jgi:hypothetical protein